MALSKPGHICKGNYNITGDELVGVSIKMAYISMWTEPGD